VRTSKRKRRTPLPPETIDISHITFSLVPRFILLSPLPSRRLEEKKGESSPLRHRELEPRTRRHERTSQTRRCSCLDYVPTYFYTPCLYPCPRPCAAVWYACINTLNHNRSSSNDDSRRPVPAFTAHGRRIIRSTAASYDDPSPLWARVAPRAHMNHMRSRIIEGDIHGGRTHRENRARERGQEEKKRSPINRHN